MMQKRILIKNGQMNAGNTEERLLLENIKEFVRIWGSGQDGSFKLTCLDGCA